MAKLLHETSHIVEADTTSSDHMIIEGVFAQAEVVNGNKRIYPKSVMESALNEYVNNFVKQNRALGEINHPDRPFADPDLAAIRITEMNWDENGKDVLGKAIVLNTPKGQTIKGLIEGGFKLGVSTRALGSLKEQGGIKYVQNDLKFTAVDCVDMPSGPDCYVNALTESTWVQKNGVWVPAQDEEQAEQIDENMFFDKLQQFVKQSIEAQNKWMK